ncbi:MAG: PorP/SprF family type IX secretion system membrane protein [Saprospiraceae bacterium]|nr:PorP/SprF family type IX secretion system membrane protein [Saprospiraceae bacterium]
MTKILRNLAIILLGLVSISYTISGQDLHYSQFYNSPINVNPASTGVFNGDQRFMASFRDQWRTVPVPWLTFSGSYDQKIYPKGSTKGFFGWGLLFNYDRQGDSKLNLTNINLSGSYTRILNQNNLISFGLMLGYSSRGFNLDALTWDKQWDGVTFDPNLSTGENFDFERISFLETALGINYRWQKSSRTKIDFGAAAFHLVQPEPNFQNDDLRLPIRLAFNAVGNFQLTSNLDIQLHALQQLQNEYQETVFGGLFKFHLGDDESKNTQLHAGLGYRTTEALFPTFAIQHKNIYVGVSYDIDLSDFNQVTNNRGGPEVHFRYIISKVKPLSDFKVCPIY